MNIMRKDLVYIAFHVTEWPDGPDTVRLDHDGEICFENNQTGDEYSEHDFYPEGQLYPAQCPHRSFQPPSEGAKVGGDYHRDEWEAAREVLPKPPTDQLHLRDHTLPKGERCWITCGPASISINSTDEGIIVDVWPAGDEEASESVATLGVMYDELESDEED